MVTARSYPVPMLLIFLSLSFDPSCSSSSSVLYVCVFKNSAKSETPGRRGLLLLVYRYFFLLKKYGKCFFFSFSFKLLQSLGFIN